MHLADPKRNRRNKTNESNEIVHTEEELKEKQVHAILNLNPLFKYFIKLGTSRCNDGTITEGGGRGEDQGRRQEG